MPPSAETHSGRNRLRYSAAGLLGAVRDAVRRVSTFQALRFPLATILLFAAVGKTYAVYAGEAAAESLFALPGWLINLTITAEAAVAIWLLTRIRQHAAWLCTLVLFSLFLGFALYQSANNNEACDCLGIWAIAPKYMAVIDAFVVTSLLFLRPPFPQQGFMARFVEYIPGHAGFALLPVFAVALCITLINLRERPPSEVAELAVLGASDYSFGESMPGSVLDHTFKLRNQARYDLHIDEVKTSCSCMAFGSNTTGGTSILKPGDTFELRVQAACPDHVSSFTGKVLVYYRRAKGGEVAGPLRHVDLRLSSNILADYTIAPLEVDFGIIAPTAPDAEPVTRLLKVEPLALDAVRAVGVEPSKPYLRCKIQDEHPSQCNGCVFIEVQVDPTQLSKTQDLRGHIALTLLSNRTPMAAIPVKGKFIAPIEILPSRLNIASNETGLISRRVSFQSLYPATIAAASIDGDERVVITSPTQADQALHLNEVTLEIDRCSAGRDIAANLEVALELHFERGESDLRRFSVPVYRFSE